MDGSCLNRRPRGVVRIVAGTCRGTRIGVPRGREVRPTSEKVREAVFDVLQKVAGLRVLDLFAGTGALGLEALSRGARECVFVESDGGVARILRRNIATLGQESVTTVIVGDYRTAADDLVRRQKLFDLLFVDPPYRMLAEVEVSLTPRVPALLAQTGLLVIEGPRAIHVDFGGKPVFEREYGETRVTMIEVRKSES
jgi:16S rRNA (guanine966-N2)-methyltransferase